MKVLLFIGVTLFATSLFSGPYSNDPNFPTEAQEVVRMTTASDGYLDEKNYKKFWQYNKYSDAQLKLAAKEMKRILVSQRILWESARESAIRKKPYFSDEAKHELQYITEVSKNNKSANHWRSLIKAASANESIDLGEGPVYYNVEYIDIVLTNLDTSFKRLDILLNHQWPPKRKEYKLSNKVSVISHLPYNFEVSKTGTQKYALMLNEKESNNINVYKDKSGLNPNDAAHKCIVDKMNKVGIKKYQILDTDYNGIPTSQTSFVYKDTTLNSGIAMQCSYSQGYIIKVFTIAPNEAKAIALLKSLRKDISIK